MKVIFQLLQGDGALGQPTAARTGAELDRLPIEFVLNLAHQFFEHILQGDETVHAAVLIHHQGEVLLPLLEFQKEGFEKLGFRREEGGAGQRAQVHRRTLLVQAPQQFLEVDDAQDAVQVPIHEGRRVWGVSRARPRLVSRSRRASR